MAGVCRRGRAGGIRSRGSCPPCEPSGSHARRHTRILRPHPRKRRVGGCVGADRGLSATRAPRWDGDAPAGALGSRPSRRVAPQCDPDGRCGARLHRGGGADATAQCRNYGSRVGLAIGGGAATTVATVSGRAVVGTSHGRGGTDQSTIGRRTMTGVRWTTNGTGGTTRPALLGSSGTPTRVGSSVSARAWLAYPLLVVLFAFMGPYSLHPAAATGGDDAVGASAAAAASGVEEGTRTRQVAVVLLAGFAALSLSATRRRRRRAGVATRPLMG